MSIAKSSRATEAHTQCLDLEVACASGYGDPWTRQGKEHCLATHPGRGENVACAMNILVRLCILPKLYRRLQRVADVAPHLDSFSETLDSPESERICAPEHTALWKKASVPALWTNSPAYILKVLLLLNIAKCSFSDMKVCNVLNLRYRNCM